MISPSTQKRINIAHFIKDFYKEDDNVEAIMISGSTALNQADQFSDLELGIFWKEKPSLNKRNDFLNQLNAEALRQTEGKDPEWMAVDNVSINNFGIDIIHNTFKAFKETLLQIVQEHSLELHQHKRLHVMKTCIPIYGSEKLNHFKKMIHYPKELQYKLLIKHSKFNSLGRLSLEILREDIFRFHDNFQQYVEKIFMVLLALNSRFFPGYKMLYRTLDELEVKPVELTQRLKKLYHLPFNERYQIINKLILELFDLILQTCEEDDIYQNREKFLKINRRLWSPEALAQWPDRSDFSSLPSIIQRSLRLK